MPSWLLVFIGGGLGSMLRYGLSLQFNETLSAFSLGTFIANIVSCFILGILIGLRQVENISSDYSLLFATGLCGGFSTFSTFSGELLLMGQEKGLEFSLFYLFISILAGILMIYLGIKTGLSL